MMKASGQANGIEIDMAPLAFCTDNAAMIGTAAYFQILENKVKTDPITATPGLTITTV